MTKTDKHEIEKNIKKVVEHTDAGGHIGGTDFGQSADAKTTSTNDKKGDKARVNNGEN